MPTRYRIIYFLDLYSLLYFISLGHLYIIKIPLINACDDIGCYYKFGDHGYPYYYDPYSQRSKLLARSKAIRQGRAIKMRQYKETRKRGGILKMYMSKVF